ncbi:MAG: hypothetical protein ABFC96_13990 [Thermoguttaceae bacterium]
MSDEPIAVILLDGETHILQPGETLSGEYWIESLEPGQLKAVEASVLWRTEGKGDEDMAVHDFWRRDAEPDQPLDPRQPQRFATVLPSSPLSYEGRIIKLRWCVRVRAFLHRGKDIVGQKSFQLGEVPPIRSRGE